jgi:hypothetical protein
VCGKATHSQNATFLLIFGQVLNNTGNPMSWICCKIIGMPATERLYLQDSYCFEAEAVVSAVQSDSLAFDRTCFYPGGGGQPPDEGFARLRSGKLLEIASAHADADEIVWHT